MNLTQKQQTYLVLAILVIAGLGGLFWKFVKPKLDEYKAAAEEVASKRAQLEAVRKSYYNRSGPEEVLRQLKAALGPWNDQWIRLKNMYNTDEKRVPEGTKYPGYYFREELRKVQKDVISRAYAKGYYAIPDTLMFPTDIPPDEAVENMLNQLYTTKFIVDFLLDNKMIELREFVVGQPVLRDNFIQILPFKVSMLVTMDDLVKFLYNVGASKRYLSVRSLALRSERYPTGTFINAEMILFTTRLLDRPVNAAPPPTTAAADEEW
ncbi:MAG: hypothetical protein J7M12_04065 [Candidatus Hydrogenedentes bacterium]|nr:hypothetical protein [Candidatus Hydrogenedentota bacterium]